MNRNLGKYLFRVSDSLSLKIILVLTNMVPVSILNNMRKYLITVRYTCHLPKQQVSTLVRIHRVLEIFWNYTHIEFIIHLKNRPLE